MPMFVVRVLNQNSLFQYFLRESESILELRVILESEGFSSVKLYQAAFKGQGKMFAVKDDTEYLLGFFGPDILRAMAVEGEITPSHSLLVTDQTGKQEWLPAWKINDLLPQDMVVDGMQFSDRPDTLNEGEMVKLRQIKLMLDNRMIDRNEYKHKMAEALGLTCQTSGFEQ